MDHIYPFSDVNIITQGNIIMSYESGAKKIARFINVNVNVVFSVIQNIMFKIFRIVDEGHLSRRFAVWASLALTMYSAVWSMHFISNPPAQYDGPGVAAIIAAIMTPLSLLAGAMMKFGEQYKDLTRAKEDDKRNVEPDPVVSDEDETK